MSNERLEYERCQLNKKTDETYDEKIPMVVKALVSSCKKDNCVDHVGSSAVLFQESVIEIINQVRRILFPGYFTKSRLAETNLEYYLGREVSELFERLSRQITVSIKHECLRHHQPCTRCQERGHETTQRFIRDLPELRSILATDTRAALDGDPAAKSFDEIIACYPGLFAITVYRTAHGLHDLNVPLLPRMMTEYAHSLTGIDIHPGAEIGESFFIDHGTGVVIGETTIIGNRVRIYQGVTLGALSLPRDAGSRFRDKKRHPTIKDDVIIYSNATILGGEAVIGARSVIGGNVWLIDSVPPDTKVLLKKPELIYTGNNRKLVLKKKSGGKG